MEQIICDHCGKPCTEDHYELRREMKHPTLGDDVTTKHFGTKQCLLEYLLEGR